MSETAPSISRSASMIRVRCLRSRRTAGPCSAFVQKSGLAMRFSISSSARRPSSASKIPPYHACAGAHGLEFPLQIVKEHFRNSYSIMAESSRFPELRPPSQNCSMFDTGPSGRGRYRSREAGRFVTDAALRVLRALGQACDEPRVEILAANRRTEGAPVRSGAKNPHCTGSRADSLIKFQGRQFPLGESMTGEPADSFEVDERLRRVRSGALGDAMLCHTTQAQGCRHVKPTPRSHPSRSGPARTTHLAALTLDGSLTGSTSEKLGSFASRFGPLPWTAPPC